MVYTIKECNLDGIIIHQVMNREGSDIYNMAIGCIWHKAKDTSFG